MSPHFPSASAALRGIEPLEERIAPASLVSPHSVVYLDGDGDRVTVTVSKGVFKASNVNKVFTFDTGTVDHHTTLHQQLQTINLDALGKAAAHLNLTVTVQQGASGDGLANIGFIKASGLDLGTVTVQGDLGRITAGDAISATPGLAKLAVHSMGALGTGTQASGGTLASLVSGAITSLVITEDLNGASISVGAPSQAGDGSIGQVEIGGSILGGATQFAGSIRATGNIGPIHVGGDVQGGSGPSSGIIGSAAQMGTVHIDGSIIGGGGAGSGAILSTGAMGAVTIGGDVVGGTAADTGNIGTAGTLASITILGGIQGGAYSFSGAVRSTGNMGAVKVSGDLTGGDGPSSGLVGTTGDILSFQAGNLAGGAGDHSGGVFAAGKIGNVTVASLQAGLDSFSGSISAGGTLGDVKVSGDITGDVSLSAGSIFSGGTMGSVTASNLTGAEISSGGDIGDLTVDGAIVSALVTASGGIGNIAAGANLAAVSTSPNGIDGSAFQAGASIGTVTSHGVAAINASGFNAFGDIGDISATGNLTGSLFVAGVQLAAGFASDLSGAGTAAFAFGSASVLSANFGNASIGKITLATPAASAAPAVLSHTTFLAGVQPNFQLGQGGDYTPGGGSAIGDIAAPGGLDTVFLDSGSIGGTTVTAGGISHALYAANRNDASGIGAITVHQPDSNGHAIELSTFISNGAMGTVDAEVASFQVNAALLSKHSATITTLASQASGGQAISHSNFRASSGLGDITAISLDTVNAIDSSIFTTGGNIGTVSVTGGIAASQLLAGIDLGGGFSFVTAANGGSSIGNVTVTGKVVDSDIIASVLPYNTKFTYGNETVLQDTNVGSGGSIGAVSIDTSESAPAVTVTSYSNAGEVHGIEAASISSVTIGQNAAVSVPVTGGGSEFVFGVSEGPLPPNEAAREITFFG